MLIQPLFYVIIYSLLKFRVCLHCQILSSKIENGTLIYIQNKLDNIILKHLYILITNVFLQLIKIC